MSAAPSIRNAFELAGRLLAVSMALAIPALGADRLPDGGVARATGEGVVEAWYEQPTERYAHGILGDSIEAGALVAIDAGGVRHEVVLDEQFVFEDITPRLADLDGDGRTEIIAIRTDLGAGAAVAVYGLRSDSLVELASSPPIGTARRWLSIAAIADFTPDSGQEIAVVATPHIGGILTLLSLGDETLTPVTDTLRGVSSHFIGSRDLTLADVGDSNGDGLAELAVPSQDRRQIVVLSFAPETRILRSLPQLQAITAPITPEQWRSVSQ